jgi:hypothetical protein
VSINFLKILISLPDVSRNDHKLKNQDVGTFDTSKDKMNTEATRRICEPHVIELLKKVPGSEGTRVYLKIMRSFFNAFIETEISDLERIYQAFWSLKIIRTWRNNVKAGERENFITNYNWECIELNVACLYNLVMKGEGKFIPILNSQGCEEMFRTLRAMGSFGLTQINFSVKDALEKLNRLSKIDEITTKYKNQFDFPENSKIRSDVSNLQNIIRTEPPTEEECHNTILKAYEDARKVCEELYMENLEECDPTKFFKKTVLNDESEEEETMEFLETAYGQDQEINRFDGLAISEYEANGRKIIKIKNLYFIDEETGECVNS